MNVPRGVMAVVILLGAVCITQGGIYHVTSSGNDGNSGFSVSSAWRSLARANQVVLAGDIVILHEGEYSDGIQPLKSGEPGNPITFQAAPGEHVVLKTAVGVWLNASHSYIIADGFEVQASSDLAILSGSHHITIRNCTMYGGRRNYSALLLRDASYCVIQNNYVDRLDAGLDGLGGDGIKLAGGSHHNLIEGNTVTHCEHIGISSALSNDVVYQSYNVVRNNTAYVNHTNFSLQDGVQRTVFENNTGYYPGLVWKGGNGWCLQFTGTNCILRFNTLYNDTSTIHTARRWPATVGASSGTVNGGSPSVLHNKIYNNTVYAENDQQDWQREGWRIDSYDPKLTQNENRFKNNIIAWAPWIQLNDCDTNLPLGAMNNRYEGNLLSGPPGQPALIRYEYRGGNAIWTVEEVKRARPDHWASSNKDGDPLFANTAGQGPAKDFSLRSGSPAIDAGVHLTVAMSGGSGTVLLVEDAGYFTDGWGIPGVEGDSIKIEGEAPVGIAGIDYGSRTITLNSPRTWAEGARVFYYRSDRFQGGAPDIGAHEFGSGAVVAEPPSAPYLVSPADGSGQASNAVNLSWSSAPGASSYRVQVAADQEFATMVVDRGGLGATGYIASDLLPDTVYYWRVAASNSQGSSAWSAVRTFIAGQPQQGTGTNLVSNPTFDGGLAPWTFYITGIGSLQRVNPGFDDNDAVSVSISQSGSNIQLYQFGIALEAQARYRLSFAAYSNSGHGLDVVVQKHEAPYTLYGLNKHIDLTTSWAVHEVEFASTTGADVSDGRLMFWLGSWATSGDQYFLDRIILQKIGLTSVEDRPVVPESFGLEQNWPNPFNPVTMIQYTVGGTRDEGRGAGEAGAGGRELWAGVVTVKVYDLLGREVSTLVNEPKAPGSYTVRFDASKLASGVYLCRMTAGAFTQTRRLILLR